MEKKYYSSTAKYFSYCYGYEHALNKSLCLIKIFYEFCQMHTFQILRRERKIDVISSYSYVYKYLITLITVKYLDHICVKGNL